MGAAKVEIHSDKRKIHCQGNVCQGNQRKRLNNTRAARFAGWSPNYSPDNHSSDTSVPGRDGPSKAISGILFSPTIHHWSAQTYLSLFQRKSSA
jgi:hypothetical protein